MVAYFEKEKIIKEICIKQHFSADATLKSRNEKFKRTPSEVDMKYFFSLLSQASQTAQTEEFMFQIVAFRPTVYRTGAESVKCKANKTEKQRFFP